MQGRQAPLCEAPASALSHDDERPRFFAATGGGAPGPARNRTRRRLAPLRPLARLAALTAGWSLLALGLLGLALPGLQGVLTLAVGLALLSLVSDTAYRLLRWIFRRWPRGWRQIVRVRRRVHAWLSADTSPADSD